MSFEPELIKEHDANIAFSRLMFRVQKTIDFMTRELGSRISDFGDAG